MTGSLTGSALIVVQNVVVSCRRDHAVIFGITDAAFKMHYAVGAATRLGSHAALPIMSHGCGIRDLLSAMLADHVAALKAGGSNGIKLIAVSKGGTVLLGSQLRRCIV